MSKAKHTPGPWWQEERGNQLRIMGPRANCSSNGVTPAWEMAVIDNAVFWDDANTEAEDRANARLIEAAPDLLEALRYVETRCVSDAAYPHASVEDRKMRDLVVAAISRAEGRT